ncbi:MAG: DUF2330 domain-containing protein, partial [Woeseiaceae bacterium]
NDKHVFNPANVALVALMLLSDRAWVSSGQWGSTAIVAFALACLGVIVLTHAKRAETTIGFLGAYAALIFGRGLWLEDPLSIPLHQLQNGALLLFAFFMISDPKTTPNTAIGRYAFASIVAVIAFAIQFIFYEPNGPILALVMSAPMVPIIDALSRGRNYQWHRPRFVTRTNQIQRTGGASMRFFIMILTASITLAVTTNALAFCGFFVAKADTSLFNRASQVVLVRDRNRTVITMANDFQGDVKDFAVVIPVPTFIERGQINVAERGLIDHLDAYTSPRLVEYHDQDPCIRYEILSDMAANKAALPSELSQMGRSAESRGVTIEARYTVGEYDILILSAQESDGLIEWLTENGYRIPEGAGPVVRGYLKQDMRFFVAKVNLEEQSRLGYSYLRPIQVAYESNKFMLPIRLGTLNAREKQELFIYTLTRSGRVETTNYRTVKLPSNTEVPEFVEDEFGDFYRAMFENQTQKENGRAVFLEYAWDMAWCDPCAADPLSPEQLRQLGVFWIPDQGRADRGPGKIMPQAQDVFVTRLHVRYDRAHFPEDLVFQETGDRQNFQGRYIIRHPFTAQTSCDATEYRTAVAERQEREAQTLANLTGWDLDDIRQKIPFMAVAEIDTEDKNWWQRLWSRD